MSTKNQPHWKQVKLQDVCEQITVGHVSSMTQHYVDEGIMFLRSQNVLPFRLNLNPDDLKYIPLEFHLKLKKSSLKPGDVIVVRTGYPGTACVVPESLPVSNCSDLVIIRPSKEVNPYYLSCIFNSTWGKEVISGRLVGSAQQHFNVSAAKAMMINLPPLPTQKRIGEILSKYDNLIDNNNRRIALLEESSHLLYKDWFVRLRFPGYESVKVVNGVPEGWENLLIEDLLKFHIGGGWGNEDSDEKYSEAGFVIRGTDIPYVASGNLTNVPFRYHQESNIRSRYLRDGDIVFEVSGGSKTKGVGRSIIITAKLLQEFNNPVICASFCKLLRPKERDISEYLWCLLFYEREIGGLIQYESQSASNIINFKFKEFISNREVLLPNNRIIQQFNEYFRPRFQQIRNLASQNYRLNQARDLLLPRLMNGSMAV